MVTEGGMKSAGVRGAARAAAGAAAVANELQQREVAAAASVVPCIPAFPSASLTQTAPPHVRARSDADDELNDDPFFGSR